MKRAIAIVALILFVSTGFAQNKNGTPIPEDNKEAIRIAAEKVAERILAEREAQRIAAEKAKEEAEQRKAAIKAEKEAARIAAEQERERKRVERATQKAVEKEAMRIVAEREAASITSKKEAAAKAKAEEQARIAAEKEEVARAEAERKAQEQASIAAEKEAAAKAKADEQARIAAEKEAVAKAEAERKAQEQARLAAEKDAVAKAKAEAHARIVAERKEKAALRVAEREQREKQFLAAYSNQQSGFVSMLELTHKICTDVARSRFGVNYIAGYRFNNYFYIGGGTGVTIDLGAAPSVRGYAEIEAGPTFLNPCLVSVPLFAYLRANFLSRRWSPFLALAAGGNISGKQTLQLISCDAKYNTSGVFFNPQLGVDFRTSAKTTLYLTVGLNSYTMPFCLSYGYFGAKAKPKFVYAADVHFGLTF